jgi:hypothetical protein
MDFAARRVVFGTGAEPGVRLYRQRALIIGERSEGNIRILTKELMK